MLTFLNSPLEGIWRHFKILSLRAGFEPARGDPIGFRVQRLNHSAITACKKRRLSLDINLPLDILFCGQPQTKCIDILSFKRRLYNANTSSTFYFKVFFVCLLNFFSQLAFNSQNEILRSVFFVSS